MNNFNHLIAFPRDNTLYRKICNDISDGCCAICGEPIDFKNERYNLDHILPLYVLKWAIGMNIDSVKDIMRHKSNSAIVHRHCNSNKCTVIPDIDALHIKDSQKRILKAFLKELKPFILRSSEVTELVRKRQHGKCAVCKQELFDDYNLRRRDSNRARSIDNAMCVHFACNKHVRHTEPLPVQYLDEKGQ